MASHSSKTPRHTPAPRQSRVPRLEAVSAPYFFAPDLERELNRLEGVTSVKVLSTGREIDEIHVVAPPPRPPKKIVRDIESLLMVRFGIRIDHRCISIVQIGSPQTTHSDYERPQIQQVIKGDGVVRVVLAIAENVITGQANSSSADDELESTGRAVIHAIEQLLHTPGALTVLKTEVASLRSFPVALVLVQWAFDEQIELLIGASLIHDDPLKAMARATLDAMNRRLVRLSR